MAWLPSGLAFGAVLLRGLPMLPGVVLGTGCVVLMLAGDVTAAAVFGLANGAACAIGLGLAGLGKPIDYRHPTVRGIGQILLAGCASYILAAYVLGPYSISQLTHHDQHPVVQNQAPDPAMEHVRGGPVQAMIPAATGLPGHSAGQAGAHHGVSILEQLLIDAIGVLLLTPVVLYCANWRTDAFKGMRERCRGALVVTALLMATTLAIYSGYLENKFGIVHTTLLVLPAAVWLALEYDLGYSLFANLAVNLMVNVGTGLGYGPFKDHSSGLPLLTVVFALTVLLIAASRAERKNAEETIHRLVTIDALTGIPNRTSFTGRLSQSLQSARRYKRKVAMMFIDLDDFKRINDSLGHRSGDVLLTEAARRMNGCLRGDSMLARFGGDEFVLMMDHIDARATLSLVAQRLADAVSRPLDIAGYACNVSCSIGISIYPDDGDSVSELMMKADMAMYKVKARGRNGHSFYSPEMEGAVDSTRRQKDYGLIS
jgi:diguanylate cyclase (GGDEF)-like protein